MRVVAVYGVSSKACSIIVLDNYAAVSERLYNIFATSINSAKFAGDGNCRFYSVSLIHSLL